MGQSWQEDINKAQGANQRNQPPTHQHDLHGDVDITGETCGKKLDI
jgi:hypothetical protein